MAGYTIYTQEDSPIPEVTGLNAEQLLTPNRSTLMLGKPVVTRSLLPGG